VKLSSHCHSDVFDLNFVGWFLCSKDQMLVECEMKNAELSAIWSQLKKISHRI
jgi:hypothetical protein